jgi:DNA-binding beta-propeller fold protein YncE
MLSPRGVGVDTTGNVYIADTLNNRIRKVNPSGVISTFAGGGSNCSTLPDVACGDGGLATSAFLLPYGVAVDASGNVYIADYASSRIRKVDTSGIITTVAGNGGSGYSGDGGPATNAMLGNPFAVAVDASGEHLHRRVPSSGPQD